MLTPSNLQGFNLLVNNMESSQQDFELKQTNNITNEILAFREDVKKAINIKNKQKLDQIYREDFTHIHASGSMDNKANRISTVLKGEKTIETSTAIDLKVRVYNDFTALATGISEVFSQDKNVSKKYRWSVLYIKDKTTWHIAASQATSIN